jgi:hypothetical protein
MNQHWLLSNPLQRAGGVAQVVECFCLASVVPSVQIPVLPPPFKNQILWGPKCWQQTQRNTTEIL